MKLQDEVKQRWINDESIKLLNEIVHHTRETMFSIRRIENKLNEKKWWKFWK